jgi:hypothetical protein
VENWLLKPALAEEKFSLLNAAAPAGRVLENTAGRIAESNLLENMAAEIMKYYLKIRNIVECLELEENCC